ncbi:DUF417 family protein [Flavobacterium enshiense]|uniref:DUF417 family protein n=1 Tax=Flavobacterium enshiense TaxID=1341165 RepID=UPI00345CD2B9
MSLFFEYAVALEEKAIHLTRIALIIVLVWIGGLKAFRYEALGIVPFVANSPTMNFFYTHEAYEYKKHMNKEGEYKPENIAWHEKNNTYLFSYGLGIVIAGIGILIALYPISVKLSAIGSFLAFGMSFVTLSFLITTPETWVPNLGDTEFGFPYLSAAGRLVIKDVIMMGAALVTMSHASKKYLIEKKTA